MSRQLGSLHRSNSHPTNLNTPITIIPLFAFPPPDFPTSNITSSMNSDTNSDISVLYSISQLNNPNIETPDDFADSQPSPSNNFQTNSSVFSKPPPQSSTSTASSNKLIALLKENSQTIHSQPNQEQPVNLLIIHITPTRRIS